MELRIREALSAKTPVGLPVGSTLVQIQNWVASLRADGLEARRIAVKAALNPGAGLVENIADALIKTASGVDRKLLSKSLQEALFYCSGFDAELDYALFRTRFVRHIDRYGTSPFIQRFLSLYFFNVVWFHTSDAFQAQATTSQSFTRDMEGVERICQRVVSASWRSFEQTNRSLDSVSARKLVRNIEHALRGE